MANTTPPPFARSNQQQPGQQGPPREVVESALGQVARLIDCKQEVVNGIALFQDGASKFLTGFATAENVEAIGNMQTGMLGIAKGQAKILLAEIDELRLTEGQLAAQLQTVDSKIHRA